MRDRQSGQGSLAKSTHSRAKLFLLWYKVSCPTSPDGSRVTVPRSCVLCIKLFLISAGF